MNCALKTLPKRSRSPCACVLPAFKKPTKKAPDAGFFARLPLGRNYTKTERTFLSLV